MKVKIDKEKLERIIKDEIVGVSEFAICTGTSVIGVAEGVQVHLVVTNDEEEFMVLEDTLPEDATTVEIEL